LLARHLLPNVTTALKEVPVSQALANPIDLARPATRWVQLLLGLVCMMAISSPQYVWTLFTRPLSTTLGAAPATIQVTFSLLIVLQTFFSPFQGWLVDRFGPRRLIAAGGLLTGFSWILAAHAGSLTTLYLSYGVLGGLGTGIVYVGVVGQMVGWFPDRRGFAAGMVAAGYGVGAILTTFPIASSIATEGYQATLLQYGALFGAVGFLAALGLKAPPAIAHDEAASGTGTTTMAMLKTPIFWLMFVMMTLMSTSGLMVISQMANFATEFGVAKLMVWGAAALPLALTIDRFTNGLTRPFFGWVSDRIGRENTMFLAFALEAVAMTAWLATRGDPVLFVLLSGLVFFGWGEIFSLFPSTLTDTFGPHNATRNYGCLYIAQGIGSIFGGPLASLLHDAAGTWASVFYVAIAADALTAVLAIAALKPLRASYRVVA
jgi:MFS transporter, OFA family, oxalate/formate antiporter